MEGSQGIKGLNFFKGLAIIYTVGLIGHSIRALRPLMLELTPYVLCITSGIVLIPVIKNRNWRVLMWLLGVGVITFFIEATGATTGRIFGPYYYTDILGIKILGVPLVIGLNWMLILFGSVNLAQIISQHKVITIAICTVCPPILDYVMEPVAIRLNYWQWHQDTIPLQNYVIWGIISCVLGSLYLLLRCRTQRSLPAFYLVILVIYFAILNLIV